MLSESQWEVIDYCTDCSAILCEMNGKLKWTPVKCPYSGGNHHTETDYQEEAEWQNDRMDK